MKTKETSQQLVTTETTSNDKVYTLPSSGASSSSSAVSGMIMIKKPLSSYMLFVQSKRAEVKTQVP